MRNRIVASIMIACMLSQVSATCSAEAIVSEEEIIYVEQETYNSEESILNQDIQNEEIVAEVEEPIFDFGKDLENNNILSEEEIILEAEESIFDSGAENLEEIENRVSIGGTCGENLKWSLDGDGLLTISGTGKMDKYNIYVSRTAPWRAYASDIERIKIEDGVTCIGYEAFLECYMLKDVFIPDSVTSIGYRSFGYCFSLSDITIPNSVTSIDSLAFSGSSELTIHGYKGSFAEEYANRYGMYFSEINHTILSSGYYYGTLQKADALTATVVIDNKLFSAAIDFDFQNATRILVDDSNKKVIYYINENGEINSLIAESQLRIYPSISISSDVKNIIYEDGKLNCNKINLTINYSFDILDFRNQEIEGYTFEFNNLKIQVFDGLYFQNVLGVKSKEKKLDDKITLSCGEKKEYQVTIYTDKSYIPESAQEQLRINCDAETISDNSCFEYLEISASNRDIQKAEAAIAKANSEQNKKSIELKKKLDLEVNKAIALDPKLSQLFTNNQLLEIKKCIALQMSESIFMISNKDRYDKKIITKAMKKLNISKAAAIVPWSSEWNTYFTIISDSNYGRLKINIAAKLNSYEWLESNSPYAAMETIQYVIDKNGNNIPDDKKYAMSGIGKTTYVNMEEFLKGMDAALKIAFDLSYGNDLNKFVDYVTEGNINRYIDGKFSDHVYDLFMKVAKYGSTEHIVKCPVDVYVYDCNGDLCGAIVGNKVDSRYHKINMYLEGEHKHIFLSGCDYQIKLVGNDVGTMDYIVKEYSADNSLVRTITYNNIPLNKGKTYKGSVAEEILNSNSLYNLVSDTNEVYVADSDTYVKPTDSQIAVESLILKEDKISVEKNKTVQLDSVILPSNATNKAINWISSDEKIASVDYDGLVTGNSAGTAIIYAVSMDNGFYGSCEVSCVEKTEETETETETDIETTEPKLKTQKITFKKPKTYKASTLRKKAVTFSLGAKTSGKGKLTYKVTKYPKKGKNYISVTKNGKVTLKKKIPKGTYKIKITASATSKYKKATKTVTIQVK